MKFYNAERTLQDVKEALDARDKFEAMSHREALLYGAVASLIQVMPLDWVEHIKGAVAERIADEARRVADKERAAAVGGREP